MRYVIFGAGAVGGVIGGRLNLTGADVVLIARGAHLDAIRANGLLLVTPTDARRLNAPTAADPDELILNADDVVVLTVKSQDTHDALNRLKTTAPPGLAVVCAQNGVANELAALRLFADVYAMYTWLPATLESPGVVVQNASPIAGVLHLGRFPSGSDERATRIATDLRRAGFACEVTPGVMRLKYRKLLANLGNALDALTGEWFETELLARARAEAEECFAAAGLDVQSAEEEWAMCNPQVLQVPGHEWGGSSSRQSLARGTGSIESDYLNGEVVLLGRLHGVSTPVNECLQRLAQRAAREGWQPRRLTLQDVEAAVAGDGM